MGGKGAGELAAVVQAALGLELWRELVGKVAFFECPSGTPRTTRNPASLNLRSHTRFIANPNVLPNDLPGCSNAANRKSGNAARSSLAFPITACSTSDAVTTGFVLNSRIHASKNASHAGPSSSTRSIIVSRFSRSPSIPAYIRIPLTTPTQDS